MRVLLFILVCSIFLFCCSGQSTPPISIGQKGKLSAGSTLVPVSINESAFEQWTKARVANDTHGQTLLIATGNVFGVKDGTSVLVIDSATFIRKIRILEGEYVGRSGWVAYEYVKQ